MTSPSASSRIAQVALRNVIKQSGARHTRADLNGDEGGVSLRIVDDRAGFDRGTREGDGGIGLVRMRERLRLVDGTIAIDSRPSAGTRIDPRPAPSTRQNADRPAGGGSPLAGVSDTIFLRSRPL